MSETLRWWFLLSFIGALMLPLCLAVFRRLPDRGYALSKPFGLLLLGYVFWLLNSLRVVPNSPRGIIFALVPLLALSTWFAWRELDGLRAWLREHWRYILGIELLFFFVFITAVWLRTTVGEIGGTEQPMDLLYLTAATRADNFPMVDPWLSGNTAAYYYFGYLLVAMLGQLASVPADVAYNIGVGMVAALALVGATGVVYDLVHMREAAVEPVAQEASEPRARPKESRPRRRRQADGAPAAPPGEGFSLDLGALRWKPALFGLAGGLMLTVMGNLVYALVFASAYGIGGNGLYDWVDVDGLTGDVPRYGQWYPAGFFQFFGSTRIYPLDNANFRVITEFPMFSFVLGDLHPHMMALPFVIMVVGLALTLFRSPEPLDVTFWLQRPLLLVAAGLLLGGLMFINTWDVATLAFVIIATAFVSNFTRVRRVTADLFVQAISFVLPLVVLAFVFYLPFVISIWGNSQADSFNAVITNDRITVAGSRPVHAFLFWGPLFGVVVPFVLARLWAARERMTLERVGLAFLPFALVLVGWLVVFLLMLAQGGPNLGTGYGNIFDQIVDRGSAWITAVVIAASLAAALLAIWAELTSNGDRAEREAPLFALTLAAAAFLLILGTEFFYVGDVFRSRMNTVFKLYYQAWALLAVSAGFALYYLAARWRVTFPQERPFRVVWAALAAVLLAGAALYPIGGTMNRARPYNDAGLIEVGGQLRGLASKDPDELRGIAWLNERSKGQDFVIAEAVGGDYTEAGRISMATGLPTILGWGGHEDQWRGGTPKARAGRFEDVNALYQSNDANVARQILAKYGVTFVYVGPVERQTYGSTMTNFDQVLGQPVFQSGLVSIYRAQ
jgi:YYY domain-containing protein